MLYLFHDNGKNEEPTFIGKFYSMKQLNNRIMKDLSGLRKEFPDDTWSRRDYLVARRVK